VDDAARFLGVRVNEIRARAEQPQPNNARYLRLLGHDQALVLAVTDGEAEHLNELLGWRAWPICRLPEPVAPTTKALAQRVRARSKKRRSEPEVIPRKASRRKRSQPSASASKSA
jgi:hypothetical protein